MYTNFTDIYINHTISTCKLKKCDIWICMDFWWIYMSQEISKQSLSIFFARESDFWIQGIHIEFYSYLQAIVWNYMNFNRYPWANVWNYIHFNRHPHIGRAAAGQRASDSHQV